MRISIIDSHPVTHYGIKSMLERNSETVEIEKSYFSAADFFDDEKAVKAHLLIIGLHLVDIDAYNLLIYIHSRMTGVKTVLYSCHFNKEVILKTIQAGANGILSKNLDSNGFIAGLQKVMSSGIFVSMGSDLTFMPENKEDLLDNTAQLTDRENEILQLVTQGIKNKEIASILNISISTVEFHRKNIYHKLEVRNVAELVTRVNHRVMA